MEKHTLLAACVILFSLVSEAENWVKNPDGPVLGNAELGTCFDVNVVTDGPAPYTMYFSWRPQKSIALVRSDDGVTWTQEPEICLRENPGSGWEDIINRSCTVKKDGVWHMWYTGQVFTNENGREGWSRIGYAISTDGVKFTRVRKEPVMVPELGFEKTSVMNPYVRWDGKRKVWRMWYAAGEIYEPNVLAYAESKDGLKWEKRKDPIFGHGDAFAWDRDRVGACEVQPLGDGRWVMFYIGYSDIDTARIGAAISDDGISGWKRLCNNPIVSPDLGEWDSCACYKPSVVRDAANDRWLLWYNGRSGSREYIGSVVHQGLDIESVVKPSVSPRQLLANYVKNFNAHDDELYTNAFSNAVAEEFLAENVPLFACPDKEIERTYYFRWWTFRKHLRHDLGIWIVSEFLPDVDWAGAGNAIVCPAGHHFREGRWLRDPKYLEDLSRFWLADKRAEDVRRRYCSWLLTGVRQFAEVSGKDGLPAELLDAAVANFRKWEEGDERWAWPQEGKVRMGGDGKGGFLSIDNYEGSELSLGGHGYRPLMGAAMWREAVTIAETARAAGRKELAEEFARKAELAAASLLKHSWNPELKFFTTGKQDGKPGTVRELNGYAPWYFGFPVENRAADWQQLVDPQGFGSRYGLTFPERRAPGFVLAYEGHECQWNGPSWPYSTSIAITALANELHASPRQEGDGRRKIFDYLLRQYASAQRRTLDDGTVVPWIDENMNPDNGDWIARTCLMKRKDGARERGKDYNHSTFCDLVISGLVGFEPKADGKGFIVDPIVPENWDYFTLERLRYRGHDIDIRWQRGDGFIVSVDRQERVRRSSPTRVEVSIESGILNVLDLGVRNDGSEDVSAIVNEATKTHALYFPAGRYKVSAPLMIRHSIRGDGYARRPENGGAYTWFDSELVCTNSEMGVVEFWDYVSVSIENIAIKCNTAEAGIRAVGITGGTQAFISEVGVFNTRGTGVWLNGWGSRAIFVDNLTVWGAGGHPSHSKGLVIEGTADCRVSEIEIMGTRIGLELQNSHTYGSNLHLWTGCMDWKDDGTWWKGTRGLLLGEGAHFQASQIYPDTCYYAIEQQGSNGRCELTNLMYWEDGSQGGCEDRDGVFYHRAPGSEAVLFVNGGMVGGAVDEAHPAWTKDFLMEGAIVRDLTMKTDYAIKPENLSRLVAGGELPDYTVRYMTNGWCNVADILTPEPGCVRARVELPDGALWKLEVIRKAAGKCRVKLTADNELCSDYEIHAEEVAKDHVKVFVKSDGKREFAARFVTESMGLKCRPLHHGRLVTSGLYPNNYQLPRYREAVQLDVGIDCRTPTPLSPDLCRHTGVPSIAVSPVNGRVWVTYYCGPTPGEDSNSVVPLLTSADGGETWSRVGEVRPEPGRRVFDPELWVAPDGKLRWTYTSRACRPNDPKNLTPYAGDEGDAATDRLMMATIDAEKPFAKLPEFRQVAKGVMMNKPLVLKDGTWLLPVAQWRGDPSACFYASSDGGETFVMRGGISHFPVENRLYDEHTVIERKDGSLLAFLRAKDNPTVLESESWDGGRTWMTGRKARFEHTSSRHALRRLGSGNLLLIKNGPIKEDVGRSRLMAFLSKDDGVTWSNGLVLDSRERVSYPDFDQRADGMIVAVHDFDRLNFQQVVVDVFSEEDVLAGRFADPRSKKGLLATAYTPKVIFDTDMITDFDDVGALACLHAMADAGECEILATVTSTRGNASVAAVEVINSYYGRPDIPVGAPAAPAMMGACAGAKKKIDPASPLSATADAKRLNEGDHFKYRKLANDYSQWVKHLDADDAPDAVRVYRKALADAPDGSAVICTVGFLTNVARLLESGPDDISPLEGSALVAKKVRKLVSMACAYPKGKEYNSMWDAEASKTVFERWPTPVYFSDFEYGFATYAGRAIAEMPGPKNPVKDIFKENMPSREKITEDPEHWRDCAFGMAGRSAWDETAVLLAVRGPDAYFGLERGEFRMIGEDGENEWRTDWEKGRHWRITERVPKDEVGRVIDELICRGPKAAPKANTEVR